VVQASQLRTGAPTFGLMYELYVIAAVVVGGASLSGGQGRIFGTLVGALVIAVIQNGMNLTSVSPHAQKVVLGMVILLAVAGHAQETPVVAGTDDRADENAWRTGPRPLTLGIEFPSLEEQLR